MYKRYVFAIIAAVGFFVIPSQNLFACSCAPFSVEESWDDSDIIFTGEVVDVQPHGDPESSGTKGRPIRRQTGTVSYTLAVTHTFTSDSEEVMESIEIRSQASSSLCGFMFEAGQEYLVYAYASEEGYYTTHLCTRTASVTRDTAQEDLEWLHSVSE